MSLTEKMSTLKAKKLNESTSLKLNGGLKQKRDNESSIIPPKFKIDWKKLFPEQEDYEDSDFDQLLFGGADYITIIDEIPDSIFLYIQK